ncbi:MAG: tRNA pseudouridine(13) synthase TruD [Planctomycetes bacterium]|nr:tRNA pseudouridine(13) synthase TruD [Planctomycetota bacterium]
MRLKVAPEDFQVREVLTFPEHPEGAYFVHRMRKEKLDTMQALQLLVKHTGVSRADIAFAGLKDRQAQTEQWISVRGRRVDIDAPGLEVRCVGRSTEPITSHLSAGNEFRIVVRSLSLFEAARLRRNLPSLLKAGFPNYFDDQRFGCLRHGQGFAMRSLLRGDPERALQRILARPSRVAISGDVRLKRFLQEHWGEWDLLLRVARGPLYRNAFERLAAHPGDFRGALAELPLRLRLIHAFAYQSFLWNRAVSRFLRPMVLERERVELTTEAGTFLGWRYLKEDMVARLRTARTPLWAPDGEGGDPGFRRAMATVLDEDGITEEMVRQHQVPGMIWKEEARPLLVMPGAFQAGALLPDDLAPGFHRITLSFRLPRGAYATMLIKRLFARPPEPRTDRERPPREFFGPPGGRGRRGPGGGYRSGSGGYRPGPGGSRRPPGTGRPTRRPSRDSKPWQKPPSA